MNDGLPTSTNAPTEAVRVPRRFALQRPPLPAEIAPLLRRRLMLVALLIAVTSAFFGTYRWSIPAQWQFYRASTWGTELLVFEAVVCVMAGVAAFVLWRRSTWSLAALRVIELVLVVAIATYVGWSQLFAWNGSRFALGGAPAAVDPFILRQVVDSMAIRWMALIVGVATLVPETPRRNATLVALLACAALALTAYVGLTDAAYRPHLFLMLPLMAFWMALASTIGLFGAYKLAELRQQIEEARELGQYRLIEKIGAGSMGEVHLAEHLLLRQPCAIKLIRPERAADAVALARFEQEVQATSRLNHWNTVRIYDYGYTDDGTFYYVMEYLPGWTLEDLVQQYGPLPPGRVIHVLRQVCAALREAHGIGLVHRDIKPANIIACERGGIADLVKLLDFGLVRRAGPRGGGDSLVTSPGLLAGTPAYMSPEQVAGDPLDARSDIYSLGGVAYYLATGEQPFVRSTAMQVLMAHMRDEPRAPRDVSATVPSDLERIILRCLAKSPADRFGSAAELDRALAACAAAGTWTADDAEKWWRSTQVSARRDVPGARPMTPPIAPA
jgi:serine/threonine-protein kinase